MSSRGHIKCAHLIKEACYHIFLQRPDRVSGRVELLVGQSCGSGRVLARGVGAGSSLPGTVLWEPGPLHPGYGGGPRTEASGQQVREIHRQLLS